MTAPKRVYSIFAPRNAARGEAVAQKEDEEQREQRSEASVSQEDNNDKEGEAQKKGNGAGSRRPARKRGAKDAGGLKQSVLSLVDDSGDSDDTSTASGTAPKGKKRAPVKGKGKGAAAAARTTKNGKATTRKKGPIATTDEDRDASDDDDDEVFVSEAGSSTSLAGSASTRRRPQRTRSRRESPPGEVGPTSLGQTPSGSFVLDLTSSPTRGAKSKRKSRLKTSTSATEGSEGPFASTSSAVSEPRSTGFAPLAEVYGAAREKRRKGLEGLEPRWPTAEEHVGGWPAPPAGGQPTPVPDLSLGKGKAKEVLAEADDVGPAFFARFERTIRQPSAAGATATACPTTSRPASSLPFLLPSPLPPHPLLGRLAAPLRAGQVPERSNDALWTVKYAPQKAEEVLGSASQQSAKWLKEWLEELKVVGASEYRSEASDVRAHADRDMRAGRKSGPEAATGRARTRCCEEEEAQEAPSGRPRRFLRLVLGGGGRLRLFSLCEQSRTRGRRSRPRRRFSRSRRRVECLRRRRRLPELDQPNPPARPARFRQILNGARRRARTRLRSL